LNGCKSESRRDVMSLGQRFRKPDEVNVEVKTKGKGKVRGASVLAEKLAHGIAAAKVTAEKLKVEEPSKESSRSWGCGCGG